MKHPNESHQNLVNVEKVLPEQRGRAGHFLPRCLALMTAIHCPVLICSAGRYRSGVMARVRTAAAAAAAASVLEQVRARGGRAVAVGGGGGGGASQLVVHGDFFSIRSPQLVCGRL